jgi:transcriptional/translational regulatory protein YebC/TACO1
MSRAINLNLTHDEVTAALSKQGAAMTSIEPLFPRGTRVVLKNADQAAVMRRALKTKIIDGPVNRTPLRTK